MKAHEDALQHVAKRAGSNEPGTKLHQIALSIHAGNRLTMGAWEHA